MSMETYKTHIFVYVDILLLLQLKLQTCLHLLMLWINVCLWKFSLITHKNVSDNI